MKLYATIIRSGVKIQHVLKAESREEAEAKLKRAYPDEAFEVLTIQDEQRKYL